MELDERSIQQIVVTKNLERATGFEPATLSLGS